MSRQLHRSAIKEQLAPFWVDMCHLLSQCRLPRSLYFLHFQRGTANSGSPFFTILKLDCRETKEGGWNLSTALGCENAKKPNGD